MRRRADISWSLSFNSRPFMGLRRGEVLGLRWEAVDFEAGTLTIRHIVTNVSIDGKRVLVEADRAKQNPVCARCRLSPDSPIACGSSKRSRPLTRSSAATATTGNLKDICSWMRWETSFCRIM